MSEVLEKPGTDLVVITDGRNDLVAVPRRLVSRIIEADENDLLGKLAAKVAAFKPDMSSKAGREAIASLAYEVATTKTSLVKMGKRLTEESRAFVTGVNAECKIIEERLDDLKETVRRPLTAWENAEKDRVKAHENGLAAIEALLAPPLDAAAEIIERLLSLENLDGRNWQEFDARAAGVVAKVRGRLGDALEDANRRAEEAAELAALRAEKAERERIEAEEKAAAEKAELARKAAEAARVDAEQRAAAEAREAERERQRLADELAHAQERAEADRAAADAIRRSGHEAAINSMQQIAALDRGNEHSGTFRDRIDQAGHIFSGRSWEEYFERASAVMETTVDALTAKLDAAIVREQAAAQAAADEAARIERERIAAEQEATETASRQAAARRAADQQHRRAIKRDAMGALMDARIPEEHARAAIEAIARGVVPAVTITY